MLCCPATSGVFYYLRWNPSTEGCAISGRGGMVWTAISKAVTYTVILVEGQQTLPLLTNEADSADEAGDIALIA